MSGIGRGVHYDTSACMYVHVRLYTCCMVDGMSATYGRYTESLVYTLFWYVYIALTWDGSTLSVNISIATNAV